jgi:sugar O-acyltransferase (sialic acid O-acetyltransferase NeuD family)
LSNTEKETETLADRGIIVGGGAFSREVLNWVWDREQKLGASEFSFFLDTNPNSFDNYQDFGLKFAGNPDDFVPQDGDVFLIAVGDPVAKDRIVSRLDKLGAKFASVIHPSAAIARTATVGRGVTIGPHAYLATNAVIGDFACINSLTGIGHDVTLGRSCTISSQADLTGGVSLGDRVFIGSGARILPNVRIEHDAKVGAGSIVVRDIKAGGSVFSQPARKI